MARLEDLVVHLRGETASLQQSLKQAQSDIKNFADQTNKRLDGIQDSQERAGRGFGNLGNLVKTYIGIETVRSIGNAALQMDALNSKMAAAVGSGQVAGEAIQFIREEAQRLGLEFATAGNAFAGFAASATRSGLTLEQSKLIFSGVAEAATAMKLSVADQGLVFRALEQMAAKGVVSMEELRGQLGERLPGAVQIFAKALGVSNSEFLMMVQNGQVGVDALVKFGEALHNEFGPAAEQASQSAAAQMARFKNTIFDLQVTLANSGAMDVFIAALQGVQAAIVMVGNQITILKERVKNNLAAVQNYFIDMYNSFVDLKKKLGMDGQYKANVFQLTDEQQIRKEMNLLDQAAEKLQRIYGMQAATKSSGINTTTATTSTPPIVKTLGTDIPKAAGRAKDAVVKANQDMQDSFKAFNVQQLATVRSFDDLKRVGLDAIQSILQSGLNAVFNTTTQKKGGFFSAFGGIFSSSLSSIFGGLFGRAAGGSVSPKTPYVVGERGPELFVPNVGGTVMNRNQMSSGSGQAPFSVVQNITIGPSVSMAVRQEVAKMLPDIRRATVAGVEDARLRGATV